MLAGTSASAAPGACARACAASSLTEAEAVRRALERPALAELREGWTGQARADGLERTLWSDPSLSYTREQLLGGGPLGEDYLTISQRFDISGRRALARRAAREREQAAEHRADAVAADVAAEARRRFYRLVLAQRREQVLTTWHERVQTHLAAVSERERAGDAAAYDRLRLERERTDIEARRAQTRAETAGAWTRLRALIEPEAVGSAGAAPPLDGELLPSAPGSADRIVEGTTDLPEAQARRAESRAVALDRRISSRWWVPRPSIGAGYKGIDVPGGRAHGFVLTLGVPLPLLERGRPERVRAEARARSLGAETSLRDAEARAAATALSQEITTLTQAVRTMTRDGTERTEALIRAAEAGYRGGEIGVIELVDAYRSAAEADLLALDLAMQARTADIELRRLTEGAP